MSKRKPCPNNPQGVWCDKKTCSRCGWNPEVAEARLEAIKAKMAEEEEKSHADGNAMG